MGYKQAVEGFVFILPAHHGLKVYGKSMICYATVNTIHFTFVLFVEYLKTGGILVVNVQLFVVKLNCVNNNYK